MSHAQQSFEGFGSERPSIAVHAD
jgi:hypothetical protein